MKPKRESRQSDQGLIARLTTAIAPRGRTEEGHPITHATFGGQRTLCGVRYGEILWGKFGKIGDIACHNCQRVARRMMRTKS